MTDYSKYIINLRHSNRDIAETVAKKYRRFTLIYLAWASFISLIEYFWLFEYFSSRINFFTASIIWGILLTVPLWIKKSWTLLFDRTYAGKVISVKYDRIVKPTAHSGRKIVFINVLEMVIDSGDKVHTVVLPCANASAIYPYEKGDIVCRYKGTKYPVFAIESATKAQLCPICGTIHKPHERKCFWCHHSVIKASRKN